MPVHGHYVGIRKLSKNLKATSAKLITKKTRTQRVFLKEALRNAVRG
jgi:hypothetical protein